MLDMLPRSSSLQESEDCWKLLCRYRLLLVLTRGSRGLFWSGAHFFAGPEKLRKGVEPG